MLHYNIYNCSFLFLIIGYIAKPWHDFNKEMKIQSLIIIAGSNIDILQLYEQLANAIQK